MRRHDGQTEAAAAAAHGEGAGELAGLHQPGLLDIRRRAAAGGAAQGAGRGVTALRPRPRPPPRPRATPSRVYDSFRRPLIIVYVRSARGGTEGSLLGCK